MEGKKLIRKIIIFHNYTIMYKEPHFEHHYEAIKMNRMVSMLVRVWVWVGFCLCTPKYWHFWAIRLDGSDIVQPQFMVESTSCCCCCFYCSLFAWTHGMDAIPMLCVFLEPIGFVIKNRRKKYRFQVVVSHVIFFFYGSICHFGT